MVLYTLRVVFFIANFVTADRGRVIIGEVWSCRMIHLGFSRLLCWIAIGKVRVHSSLPVITESHEEEHVYILAVYADGNLLMNSRLNLVRYGRHI